jgi:hypothetical protein
MVSGSYARHRTDERQRIGQAACLSTVSFARSRDAVSANSCVIEMTLATATSALESRFDHFLYAAVREDPHGPPLTVLSLLARLDIDPWTEAARLAQLPGEAAARALAGLISASPKGSAAPADSETIAARLITLLPRRSERGIAAQTASSGGPRVIRIPSRATIAARGILCLIVLLLLAYLASLAAKKALAAPATVAPAARAVRPDAPP